MLASCSGQKHMWNGVSQASSYNVAKNLLARPLITLRFHRRFHADLYEKLMPLANATKWLQATSDKKRHY